jgi:signal transduction histidine kinase
LDGQLDRLSALRDDVREAPTAAVSAVMLAYRITIADLVSLRETIAQSNGGSAELVGHIRAAAAVSAAVEFASERQFSVAQTVAAARPLTPADQQTIVATDAGYDDAMSSFAELAPVEWVGWLDHTVAGRDVLIAARLEDTVARTPVGAVPSVDRTQWTAATTAQISLLHQVERRVDGAVGVEIGQLYRSNLVWLLAEIGVVVVALTAAVAMAILQSRSMIRRLRRLADGARSTAFSSLPNVVQRLRSIGPHTIDPDEFARQAPSPAPDEGRDEIGYLSAAFLAVHWQAVRTLAELANARAGMSQIFVHLARRNQRLVGALIHELDGAERGEADPERLATLFRLDQLATRMGRYNDNLLVVGGYTRGRSSGEPVALDVILRGAQSKIERYQQIRYAVSDDRLRVRGDAVHDLMNLIAELLDNATQFSPPATQVLVYAGLAKDRVVIRIADQGVGIPHVRLEQLNRNLAAPPAVDISAVRSMGLTVAAHLAARHGIQVALSADALRGTIAEASLPPTVCWPEGRPNATGRVPIGTVPRPRVPADASWQQHVGRSDAGQVGGTPTYQDVAERFAGFFAHHEGQPLHPPPPFRGAADAGWAAAAAASAPRTEQHTGIGLPRRDPMAQLVPGAVPSGGRGVGAVDYRTPAAVAASVAAFARGNNHSRALRGMPNPHHLQPREEDS